MINKSHEVRSETTADHSPLRPQKARVECSVVVPVYKPGRALVELCGRIRRTLGDEMKISYEVLLINDGCSDENTMNILSICRVEEGVKIVHLTRNYGRSSALIAGFVYASGKCIVTIDDDLQQSPEDIRRLFEVDGHDVVMARYVRRSHSAFIKITGELKFRFERMVFGINHRMSPLLLIRESVISSMIEMKTSRPYIPALIFAITRDIVTVDLNHSPSAYGRSRYTFKSRVQQFSNLLIGNSSVLTRLVAVAGIVVAVFSLLMASVLISMRLMGYPIALGWTSLMSTMLLLGGMTLLTLGIIGEYLLRILEVVGHRPAFVVRSLEGFKNESGARGGGLMDR